MSAQVTQVASVEAAYHVAWLINKRESLRSKSAIRMLLEKRIPSNSKLRETVYDAVNEIQLREGSSLKRLDESRASQIVSELESFAVKRMLEGTKLKSGKSGKTLLAALRRQST